MTEKKDFLEIRDFSQSQLQEIFALAHQLRHLDATDSQRLSGKLLACVFEKPSTRTRVSFEAAIKRLGGDAIILHDSEMQMKRGETIADTARVLSANADAIMMRTSAPERLQEMAENATVPVINGLTDASHPCQVMADMLTFTQMHSPLKDATIAWSGDCNNMLASWIEAAETLEFSLRIACPDALNTMRDKVDAVNARGGDIVMSDDPYHAVKGADCIVTDTWVSMGDDESNRHNLLMPYQVNAKLMQHAGKDAVFMHCLPAHRGEEVTADVIDGPRSIVWQEM
ncbi:MAG: ornithine carbamoyltransferase [Pseudomonadota bacterium]